MSDAELQALEHEARGQFAIVPDQDKTVSAEDGFGRTIVPVEPEKPTQPKSKPSQMASRAPRSNKWTPVKDQ